MEEYFEKTPRKANRWFRAFVVLALLYGITFSLHSVFNWIFFLVAGYSLFMSYFTLPVQPKIFQKQPKSFNAGGRGSYTPPASPLTPTDRVKKVVRIIMISVVSLFVFLFLVGIFAGNDDEDQTTTIQQQEGSKEEESSDSPQPNDESAQSLTDTGMDLYSKEQFDESDKYFDRALETDPNFMEAVYGKGIVLYHRGSLPEANTYFTRAYDGGYRYAWLSWVLADTYEKNGANERAVELYKESVGLDSTFVDSYDRLAALVPAERDKYLALAQKHTSTN
jgi:tetratricopeptide (TPR) repeat protein